MPSFKKMMTVEAVIGGLCTLILLMVSPKQGLSFALGALVMTSNFYFLKEMLDGLFNKKSIALVTFVVVNKYAILGGVLYFAVLRLKVPYLPFGCGIFSLLTSIILASLMEYRAGKFNSAL